MLSRLTQRITCRPVLKGIFRGMATTGHNKVPSTMKPIYKKPVSKDQSDIDQNRESFQDKRSGSERRTQEKRAKKEHQEKSALPSLHRYMRINLNLWKQYPTEYKLMDLISRLKKEDATTEPLATQVQVMMKMAWEKRSKFTLSYIIVTLLQFCKEKGILVPRGIIEDLVQAAIQKLHIKENAREHVRTLKDLYDFVVTETPSSVDALIESSFKVLIERSNSILMDDQAFIVNLLALSKYRSENVNRIVEALAQNIQTLAPVCSIPEFRLLFEAYLVGETFDEASKSAVLKACYSIADRLIKRPVHLEESDVLHWIWLMASKDRLTKEDRLNSALTKLSELTLPSLTNKHRSIDILMHESSILTFMSMYGDKCQTDRVKSWIDDETKNFYLDEIQHPGRILAAVGLRRQILGEEPKLDRSQVERLKRSLECIRSVTDLSEDWPAILEELCRLEQQLNGETTSISVSSLPLRERLTKSVPDYSLN